MKYVLVTGSVVSGSGKGVTATSVVVLLKACGLRVTSIKIDPYLNTDAGTMSPFEDVEEFAFDDCGEDVPQVTDAIQDWSERVAVNPVDGSEGPADVCVIELGGTIGDIESDPYIEALGQFSYCVGLGNFCLVHFSVVPVLNVVGERKTKSTQHSVWRLRDLGLTPDILACWSAKALEEHVKEKLAQSCHVPLEHIFTLYDAPNIWHIPLLLKDQKAHLAISKVLNLASILKEPFPGEWASRAELCDNLHVPVRTDVVGKYTGLSDAYLSVLKAPLHAYEACRKKLVNDLVPACELEKETEKENPEAYKAAWNLLKGVDGIRVPGGFGDRGVEGKILAAKSAKQYDSRNFVDERHHHRYKVIPDDKVESLEKAGLSFASKDETGKRTEVKEDLVKTEKKGSFVTEEAVNPTYISLRNTIIGFFLLLALIYHIISVFLDMAAKFSINYSSSSPHFDAKPCYSFTDGQKNPPYIGFISMVIGCFLLLKLISYIKSVSTNYSSSSPRFHAESCRSLDDGQTNSNLAPSPVSYPMRIAVSPGKVQQVFLNFRGEQLRYNFVSHITDAFQKHEIKFFIDKYEQRGKDLKHLFFRIEESSIALAIFSTRYPESSWCMDELVKMKKFADQGKLRVIPIFYKVEAEDVRKPTSDSEFGKNFWRLAEASSGDQIKNWKEALECISEKMGLSLGDKSSEADFVKEIVKDVQRVIEAIGLEEEENHGGKRKEKCPELQLSR